MNQIDVVVDVRQSPDTGELIVSKQKLIFNGEATLDGPPVETRVGPVIRKAAVTIFGFDEMGTGLILAACVKNVGTVPFPIDAVVLEFRFEEAHDSPFGPSFMAKHTGESFMLVPRNEAKNGPLLPGEERDYSLPGGMYDGITLLAVSLKPWQFWIAAYCGKEELGRVGGEYIQPFLRGSRIRVNRRAAPIFYTMPESIRFAVIKAVVPLRDLDSDQWPTAGASPVEGTPSTFVIRSVDDPILIVSPTDNRGVEIVDIVRKGVLEQFRKSENGEGAKP